MTQSPSRIRELLARYDVIPRKSLGQHFLADANIIGKISRLVPDGVPVLEVGAGTGALTVALAKPGRRVITYEVDERLRPVLAEVLEGLPDVEVRYRDVMTVDLSAELSDTAWVLAGNLPYQIATPLILDVLRHVTSVRKLVVMVQREVAERLTAGPGTKAYGVPSVVAQLHSVGRIAFTVPPQLFVPPPAVSSAVVTLDRHARVVQEADRAIDLAAAAFGQRRKMIRTSLVRTVSDLGRVLTEVGIDERLRAESLTPDDYVAIARAEGR